MGEVQYDSWLLIYTGLDYKLYKKKITSKTKQLTFKTARKNA
jgi:hypothetical protein